MEENLKRISKKNYPLVSQHAELLIMQFSKIPLSNQRTRETVHPENCNTDIPPVNRVEGIQHSAFPESLCRQTEIPSRV